MTKQNTSFSPNLSASVENTPTVHGSVLHTFTGSHTQYKENKSNYVGLGGFVIPRAHVLRPKQDALGIDQAQMLSFGRMA